MKIRMVVLAAFLLGGCGLLPKPPVEPPEPVPCTPGSCDRNPNDPTHYDCGYD